jgi:hypothetical protein
MDPTTILAALTPFLMLAFATIGAAAPVKRTCRGRGVR